MKFLYLIFQKRPLEDKKLIKKQKEAVLRDRGTGDMFTGNEARDKIGLPFGTRGKVNPVTLVKFDIFIQSTSSNRKLKSNTLFLYEAK